MRRCTPFLLTMLAVAGLAVPAAVLATDEPAPKPASPNPATPTPAPAPAAKDAYVLDHAATRIDGTKESLDAHKGKVILIVNVASRCGMTPQYAALQKLYTDKKDKGLVVLGFPANDFEQETGSNKEIAEFCTSKFGVTFPMYEKVTVTGADKCDLYKDLSAQPAPIGGDPKWNFTKFLVDRAGNVVARFDSRVRPDSPEVVKKIDELLASGG